MLKLTLLSLTFHNTFLLTDLLALTFLSKTIFPSGMDTPAILALDQQEQEDKEFKVIHSYMMRVAWTTSDLVSKEKNRERETGK